MISLRCLVEDLLRGLEFDRVPLRKKVLENWDTIAGKRLSEYCKLAGFDGDVVIVKTSNPGAAMELKYRSGEIVTALNRIAEKELFTSLKILQRPVSTKDRKVHFGR
jgi:hypothetical protein